MSLRTIFLSVLLSFGLSHTAFATTGDKISTTTNTEANASEIYDARTLNGSLISGEPNALAPPNRHCVTVCVPIPFSDKEVCDTMCLDDFTL